MSTTEKPPEWAIAAVTKITDLLFAAVRRNKGDVNAQGCFVGCGSVESFAQIVEHERQKAQRAELVLGALTEIKSGLDEEAPDLSQVKQPVAMLQNAEPLAPKIKTLLRGSKKALRIPDIALELTVDEPTVELAINQKGSGLTMHKGGWIKEDE